VRCSFYYLPLIHSDWQYSRSRSQTSPSHASRILQKLKLIWARNGFKFIVSARVPGHTPGPLQAAPKTMQCITIAVECARKSIMLRESTINAHGVMEVYIHWLFTSAPATVPRRKSFRRPDWPQSRFGCTSAGNWNTTTRLCNAAAEVFGNWGSCLLAYSIASELAVPQRAHPAKATVAAEASWRPKEAALMGTWLAC